ncbi:Do family serine endopeptidase [Sandaracinobacteroides saxicola]|uniref:Do family serine endopeptidase n=2 Tax=Sandaracinobacteroides saxicola TaxID=2759707 RepID=A0A7G5IMD1_9SPHN|nr:Do family serine endopeptidase [Sandaracinobacteroides saxicola]
MVERTKALGYLAVGAVAGLALALTVNWQNGNGGALAHQASELARDAAPAVERTVPGSAAQISLSFAPVARAAQPAVVNIFTAKVVRNRDAMMADPFFRFFNSQPRVSNSLGSGVIVDGAKGLIITNNHVVEGADQIIVALADRREYAARLLFADARLDLALLKVDPRGAALPALKLGDSDRAQVGDLVLAIGNPFGVGQTVTQGIVSALARTGIGVSDTQFFIQTDAAINPGNSGGALLGMNGELLGINSAILSRGGGSNGVGFAVPSNMVRMFLRAADSGKLVTAWIGAEGEALTSDTAREAGLDRPTGVLMTGVSPGSPAAAAGLRAGDIVYAIDGKEVSDPGSLRYRIATLPVGERVKLTVVRDGKARNVELALAAPPEVPARQLTQVPNGNFLAGITVANLSPAFAQELGAGLPERGVVVVRVPGGAPAARTGFPAPGDLIEMVNGTPVRTVGDLGAVLPNARAAMRFVVNRGGQRVECAFQVPGSFGCRQLAVS